MTPACYVDLLAIQFLHRHQIRFNRFAQKYGKCWLHGNSIYFVVVLFQYSASSHSLGQFLCSVEHFCLFSPNILYARDLISLYITFIRNGNENEMPLWLWSTHSKQSCIQSELCVRTCSLFGISKLDSGSTANLTSSIILIYSSDQYAEYFVRGAHQYNNERTSRCIILCAKITEHC